MSLAWFMLEDPSITKSFHQKNLPWPSSSHHWIHQVADYLTSSHTDGAAPVCMQLLFNHRTRQDCPRDGELGCCHSTCYKDFSLFGGPWPLLHFRWQNNFTLDQDTIWQWPHSKTILLTSLNFLLGQLGASTILAYNDPKYFCRPAFFLTIPLLF